LLAEWLLQEVHCSSLERPRAAPLIRASSDENDRNAITRGRQMTLKLKSIHAWHLHIKNKARRIVQTIGKQKFIRRGEDLDHKAHRLDESSRCLAERGIIFYKREYPSPWHSPPCLVRG